MAKTPPQFTLSIVVPVFNEADGVAHFNQALLDTLRSADLHDYEIIYCDDGSTDKTAAVVTSFHQDDARIKLVKLSRNFGKENALTAGIAQAQGDAIIMLDGDGQHPVEMIPEFVKAWQSGAQVVVGVRAASSSESWLKRLTSKIFYKLYNVVTSQKLVPGSTDYRLIDKAVQKEFLVLGETNRITRGLIDWLGFERTYVTFNARSRHAGEASYGYGRLIKLAANTFVSLSPAPLYAFGYLGILITAGSLLLGGTVFVEQLLLGDPLGWNFTGTAMLSIFLLFLVGVVLMSQGMLSLYISHMHAQSMRRPLYIIDHRKSAGIETSHDK